MKYSKPVVDKHGLMSIKKGKTKYFEIKLHGALRTLCSYYKRSKNIVFEVNKVVDEKGVFFVGVTRK
jgi:hypothetical protein